MAEPFLPSVKIPISLTVSTQNCNSLNLTTNVRSYELKIAAIKNLNTHAIFLCDTRLVSNKGISGAKRLNPNQICIVPFGTLFLRAIFKH